MGLISFTSLKTVQLAVSTVAKNGYYNRFQKQAEDYDFRILFPFELSDSKFGENIEMPVVMRSKILDAIPGLIIGKVCISLENNQLVVEYKSI